MSWDEKKIEILKSEWGKGKTASQIAELIGGVSRNAVIGKAHRLNLSAKSNNNNFVGGLSSKKNSEKLLIASPSIPTYGSQSLGVNDGKIVFR